MKFTQEETMHKCLPNIEVEFSENHMDSGEKNRNNYFFKVRPFQVFSMFSVRGRIGFKQ
jgi:hypothetical protein